MNIIERVKNIILKPKQEWEIIEKEDTEISDIILKYVIPLAVIPAIASFIGYLLLSFVFSAIFNTLFSTGKVFFSFWYAIKNSFVEFAIPVIVIVLASVIISALSDTFKSKNDLKKTFQLLAYSFTPFLIAGILMLVPYLGYLGRIAGIYGFYLLYLGIKPMLKTPEDQHVPYLAVSIVVVLVLSSIFGFGLSFILL